MIVLAESNFILEIALRQEEAADAERILALAASNAIRLVIPACCLFEPYWTLARNSKQRKELSQGLTSELRYLARSENFNTLEPTLETVTRTLIESGDAQAESLARTLEKVLDLATIIPLTAEVMRHTLALQLVYELPAQDSVVFASIDHFLLATEKGPKLFANRNRKDFQDDDIEGHLGQYDCKLLTSFTTACQYIDHVLKPAARG
jgi:predicted nucleic acid-binding protein